MRYFWVIGGGLLQVPILEKLRSMDIKTIVSDASDQCVCAGICDYFVQVDIFDIDGHIAKAEELIKAGDEVIGVLAAGIDAPVTMSVLAEHLKLPVVPSSISKLVHNKAEFRKKMQELGISVPIYSEFKNNETERFTRYLDSIDPPFIIKNVDSSASRGTKIFHKRDRVEEQSIFQEACNVSRSNSCLVESLWTGTEHTVETFFDIEGNFHRLFITDRFFDYSTGFPIETGLKNPTSLSHKESENCYKLAKLVADKVGIKLGAAKFDMIYTAEGPKIIEMTTRLSGGFDCQYLVPAATGKDVLSIAIMTSLGALFKPELNNVSISNIGLTGSIWPAEGRIISINGLEAAEKIKFVKHIFMRKKAGDYIEHYNNCAQRACFIIVSAPTLIDAEMALYQAQETIKIEVKK